jgi:hypothetical protein
MKNVPGYVDCEEGKPAEHKAPNNDANGLCCFRLHFELSHLESVSEPEFLNVYGAQESIPMNQFRQTM